MKRIRSAWFAALLLAVLPFAAEAQSPSSTSASVLTGGRVTAVPFRAGTILSAEITRQKPQFDVESPFDTPAFDNPAWVELIVKLDSGRTVSRFDYELEGTAGKYACFAVAEGADGYSVDSDKWTVKSPHPLKYYRLLFPVKQEEFAGAVNELIPVTLKVKLFESTLPGARFKVRVMPQGYPFTRVSSVKPEGICNLTYKQAFEQSAFGSGKP